MKKLSLQWRITLLTAFLIAFTCILMNFLIGYSGKHYMDVIGSDVSSYKDIDTKVDSFDPSSKELDDELTIIVNGAQESFSITNWYITSLVTIIGAILAYFVSGQALKPLDSFAIQVANIEPSNLQDMKLNEDVLPEFKALTTSFNKMIDRLVEGFNAQGQFTGNAAHELRTPLALMQAQIELFSLEHQELDNDTSTFLNNIKEQIEKMTKVIKTLLEMSELRIIPCNDKIELAPMIDEIFTDLAPLADKKKINLNCIGDATIIGSDTLIYRLFYNLIENAIQYNKENGSVNIDINSDINTSITIKDTGFGIPYEYQESIFQPFFRIDKARSKMHGGVGLGLALVYEITKLHGGSVKVIESDENGTTILVTLNKKETS